MKQPPSPPRLALVALPLLVLGLALVGVGLVVIPSTSGAVRTTEISTWSLKHRAVHSYRVLEVDLFEVESVERSSLLRDYLLVEGYLEDGPADPGDWRLAYRQTSRSWEKGEVRRIYQDLWGSGEDWVSWSRANPPLARALWPEVIRKIRERDYDSARFDLLLARSSPDELPGYVDVSSSY